MNIYVCYVYYLRSAFECDAVSLLRTCALAIALLPAPALTVESGRKIRTEINGTARGEPPNKGKSTEGKRLHYCVGSSGMPERQLPVHGKRNLYRNSLYCVLCFIEFVDMTNFVALCVNM